MHRVRGRQLEVLLVHPGGPYWAKKDAGAWSIPKGEVGSNEELLAAAQREFTEETGLTPSGPYLPLGGVKQRQHKVVYAWAFEGDCDPAAIVSETFEMEWPPRSGRMQAFPEADRAAFFTLPDARHKILAPQRRFLDELEAVVNGPRSAAAGDPP